MSPVPLHNRAKYKNNFINLHETKMPLHHLRHVKCCQLTFLKMEHLDFRNIRISDILDDLRMEKYMACRIIEKPMM